MRSLQAPSMILLSIFLVVGLAVAEENPFAQTAEETPSAAPKSPTATGDKPVITSALPRLNAKPTHMPQQAETLLFTPHAFDTVEAPAGADTNLKRMGANQSPQQPASTQQSPEPSISAAIFESTPGQTSGVRQVAGQIDNPFFEPADNHLETSPNPELSSIEFSPESELVVGQSINYELADAAATQPVVVPNTDSDSLPSQHTGPQRPSVDVSWTQHGEMNLGQACRCAMVVTNTGDSLVRNIEVEAAIPPGVNVVAADPAPLQGTSRWNVGDLNSGESRSIELSMVPQQRGNIALNAFVRFTGYSTSVVAVQEPMLQIAVQGPDSVTVGEQAGYVIRVDNPGSGTARNVVIEAQVPPGMRHRSGTVPTIKVGTLNPGESRQIRLILTATDGGRHQLTARAVADGGLNHQAQTAVVVSKPSLDIKIVGPDSAATGQPEDYTVTVTNTGNIPSINVRAKYKIPEASKFVRADRGGVHHEADRVIDWFVGTLQPGESTTYRVTLEASSLGEFTHLAGVVSEHTAVTTVTHTTDVLGVPDLVLDVAAAEPAPATGQETTVRIIVRNEGSVDARNVGLSCELPSGCEFTDAEAPSEFLAENGVVIFRSVDAIQAGGEATYLITARCLRPGNHRVRVRLGSPSLSEPVIGEGIVKTRSER